MSDIKIPLGKVVFLVFLVVFYLAFAAGIKFLVLEGVISPLPPTDLEEEIIFGSSLEVYQRLGAAENFFDENLVRDDGHINLYYTEHPDETLPDINYTNSEAMSYYILWKAERMDRQALDRAIIYVENNMIHPRGDYLMWKLNSDGAPIDDGENIATDADLRMIRALFLAEEKWANEKYPRLADTLRTTLEEVAITEDRLFAPYGGVDDQGYWTTQEVWLSYSDFQAFRELSQRYGQPWRSVYDNMKTAVINSQLENGLYNTQLNEEREYHNTLDNGLYSINSLWVMVRAAESGDIQLMESANKSLGFYKDKYSEHGMIHMTYNSEGEPVGSDAESPWVYALVSRAAISLDDAEFANDMMIEMFSFQETNETSEFYGAFIEGSPENRRVSQFTMQESILTIQTYLDKSPPPSNQTREAPVIKLN